MTGEQRFFPRVAYLGAIFLLVCSVFQDVLGEEVEVAEGRISLNVPLGWEKSDLNQGEVLAGWATADSRSSVFLREMNASSGGSMDDLLRNTVNNYEKIFDVKDVGEFRTGQVNGPEKKWPAIFSMVEADVDKGEKTHEMRFYLMIFDTGSSLYFFQGSTTIPVSSGRENDVMGMMRSIVAKS
ncbi:MAG: hypothetical protein CMO55_13055 [Verrucomicrobiales bacterium]|nr:hypothetical protein [Verrucomicrobiales bacterium]